MKLTFLGTNGWYDSATGNTPSAVLETANYNIIFDAGFGLAKADTVLNPDKPTFLFISHFHIDHICGLHTLPKFNFKQPLTIFGRKDLKTFFKTVVNFPYAVPISSLNYKVNLVPLKEGKYNNPFSFSCRQLKHTNTSLGYRLELDDKVVVYCSDTAVCENDSLLAQDADLLIHECAFVPGETSDWGHSNPEEVAKMAKDANVKRVALTHFGAARYSTLEIRKNSEATAKAIFPNTIAATDGLVLEI